MERIGTSLNGANRNELNGTSGNEPKRNEPKQTKWNESKQTTIRNGTVILESKEGVLQEGMDSPTVGGAIEKWVLLVHIKSK